jgi:hypothetical protein
MEQWQSELKKIKKKKNNSWNKIYKKINKEEEWILHVKKRIKSFMYTIKKVTHHSIRISSYNEENEGWHWRRRKI